MLVDMKLGGQLNYGKKCGIHTRTQSLIAEFFSMEVPLSMWILYRISTSGGFWSF